MSTLKVKLIPRRKFPFRAEAFSSQPTYNDREQTTSNFGAKLAKSYLDLRNKLSTQIPELVESKRDES